MKKNKRKSFWTGLILNSIFGIGFLITGCDSNKLPDKIEAEVFSEEFVKQKLKSPATAEFGSADVIQLNDYEFEVDSYVDSENSFGALIRMNYTCKIKFSKDGNTYTVSDLDFTEN